MLLISILKSPGALNYNPIHPDAPCMVRIFCLRLSFYTDMLTAIKVYIVYILCSKIVYIGHVVSDDRWSIMPVFVSEYTVQGAMTFRHAKKIFKYS